MSLSADFVFHQPNCVFVPGEFVSGYINIQCDESIFTKGIYLGRRGFSYVKWIEFKNRSTQTYKSEEHYYKEEKILWGNGIIEQVIPPGQHQIPFSYKLPEEVPSSYESEDGHLRHECRVRIRLGMLSSSDYTKTVYITVISLCDLNTIPTAEKEISRETSKTLGVLCCRSGEISMTVTLDRAGYVPGEYIYINAVCTNDSSKTIKSSKVKFYRVTYYLAQGHHGIKRKRIDTISKPQIAPHSEYLWENIPLYIPALPHTGLDSCTNTHVCYYLIFTMDPSGMSLDLDLEVPVIIGNIPLRSTLNTFQDSSIEDGRDISRDPTVMKFVTQYPGMPVPSFICDAGETNDKPEKNFKEHCIIYELNDAYKPEKES